MLNGFQITNFKAFADSGKIPLKPMTLIFGANSSGKSSIFQSLLMLKQTIEGRVGLNTVLLTKGNLVDLGSFREFIYNHEENLSFSFKAFVKAHSIEYGCMYLDPNGLDSIYKLHEHIELLDKCRGDDPIGLNVSFSLDRESNSILISYIDLYIGDDSYPVITYKKNGWKSSNYKFIGNFNHNFWRKYWEVFDAKDTKKLEEFVQEDIQNRMKDPSGIYELFTKMSEEEKAHLLKELTGKEIRPFPQIQDQVDRDETNSLMKNDLNGLSGFQLAIEEYKILFQYYQIGLDQLFPTSINNNEIKHLMGDNAYWDQSRDPSIFLLTAGSFIQKFLEGIIYIGPLRNYPERYYRYGGHYDKSVGICGEMAPGYLSQDPELLLKVNRELERFGSKYELRVNRLRDEESNPDEVFALKLYDKLTGISANIRDVGFGFSQVLPVIVQSMLSNNNTVLIEQPELHLHPALQAELGDLFINAALGEQKNKFLIETHSEHLILRILRRIRETTEGELPKGVAPIRPDDLSVLYVQPTEKGSEVIPIPVNEEGEFERPWPQGFFAERAKELF